MKDGLQVQDIDLLHQNMENEQNRAHENETQAVRNLNYVGNETVA